MISNSGKTVSSCAPCVIRLLGCEPFPPFAPSPSSLPHISFSLPALLSETLGSRLQIDGPVALWTSCKQERSAPGLGSQHCARLPHPQTPFSCPSNILSPSLIQDSIQEHTLHLVVSSLIPHLELLPSLALSSTPWYIPLADPERGAL